MNLSQKASKASNKFYVYAYVNENYQPYYIGKGCGKRVYADHGEVKVPKDQTKIWFIDSFMEEKDAYELERLAITRFGRKDLKQGILVNKTNGGQGGWANSGTQRRGKRIWITNGKDSTLILKEESIPEGWFPGRTTAKASQEFKDKMKIVAKGPKSVVTFWITDGKENKKVYFEELQNLPFGWTRGRTVGKRGFYKK